MGFHAVFFGYFAKPVLGGVSDFVFPVFSFFRRDHGQIFDIGVYKRRHNLSGVHFIVEFKFAFLVAGGTSYRHRKDEDYRHHYKYNFLFHNFASLVLCDFDVAVGAMYGKRL